MKTQEEVEQQIADIEDDNEGLQDNIRQIEGYAPHTKKKAMQRWEAMIKKNNEAIEMLKWVLG